MAISVTIHAVLFTRTRRLASETFYLRTKNIASLPIAHKSRLTDAFAINRIAVLCVLSHTITRAVARSAEFERMALKKATAKPLKTIPIYSLLPLVRNRYRRSLPCRCTCQRQDRNSPYCFQYTRIRACSQH